MTDAPPKKYRVACPHCTQVVLVPPAKLGKNANCPKCKEAFEIPAFADPVLNGGEPGAKPHPETYVSEAQSKAAPESLGPDGNTAESRNNWRRSKQPDGRVEMMICGGLLSIIAVLHLLRDFFSDDESTLSLLLGLATVAIYTGSKLRSITFWLKYGPYEDTDESSPFKIGLGAKAYKAEAIHE